MSFKTAKENFESALKIAESSENSEQEHIASGLIELTKAIRSELRNIKIETDQIKSRIGSLR